MGDLGEYLSEFGAAVQPPQVRTDTSRLIVQPKSMAPAGWVERAYPQQDDAYIADRMPGFIARLDRLTTLTNAIELAINTRISSASVVGSGERAVMHMPVAGGQCPATGPLAYVYGNLFEAAKSNLADLGFEKPPRFSDAAVVQRWTTLIARNIDLLFVASNIYPFFRFPEAQPRSSDPARGPWGARETLRTQQGGFGPGQEPVMRDGLPYPAHNGFWGMQRPQEAFDREAMHLTTIRNLMSVDPSYRDHIADHTVYALDLPFRAYENGDHVRPKTTLTWQRFANPLSADLLNEAWTTLRVLLGRRRPAGSTGAAARGLRIFAPLITLQYMQDVARSFSRVSLLSMLQEALGFYVFNHNVWYRDKLGLTAEQLRAQQQALISANLASDPVNGAIVGTTAAVGTLINPIIGVIVGVLNEIGKALLTAFIQVSADMPKPLFLRVPDPACRPIPEEQLVREIQRQVDPTVEAPPSPGGGPGPGGGAPPPPAQTCPAGHTGTPPNCVPTASKSGSGGILIGAGALLLLSQLLKR